MAKGKRKNQEGISPAGKVAILAAMFGIPALFALSSYGLGKLFELAPYLAVVIVVLVSTAYTAYIASLMYDYYEVDAPILRFIPCLCEVSLIDTKYRLPSFGMYAAAIGFGLLSQIPYSVVSGLGEFGVQLPFYCMLLCLLCLAVIQVIKGIGLMGCMKDIAGEWYEQTHTDVGAITKFGPLAFIPFVRVVALYSISKPLSTMVSFMGVSADDVNNDEDQFVEE